MGKPFAPPPLNLQPPSFNLDNKISPSILYIIIILAIIFFVSALLHLILRFFLKRTQNDPDEPADVTALQGQLRQLFHLHDAGVDQLYIDTLPVFPYKAIIGVKDPFDCAVCLCEFAPKDKLRLLPKCSHAFHMDCIDTWLLSHSTCPLCRSSLLPDFTEFGGNGYRNPFPFVCVLESGSVENSREIRESVSESDSQLGSNRFELGRKSSESWRKEEGKSRAEEEKIVTVKLGKFKNLDEGVGSSVDNMNDSNVSNSNNDLSSRRCYSMGSFAYVLDEKTSLQVPAKTLMKKQRKKKPGRRAAMSEYGFDSRRYFNGIEAFRTIEIHCRGGGSGSGNEGSKRESFSVSKIWQRGVRTGQWNKKGNDCSSRRTISEIEIDIDEVELEGDEEIQSCCSVDSVANPSGSISNRRTLLWLMGKQSKVVHNQSSSVSSNV